MEKKQTYEKSDDVKNRGQLEMFLGSFVFTSIWGLITRLFLLYFFLGVFLGTLMLSFLFVELYPVLWWAVAVEVLIACLYVYYIARSVFDLKFLLR